jgi:hypothetical protein
MIRMKGDHHAKTPSYFAVGDRCGTRMRTLPARPWLPALREIVKQMLDPFPVDAPNDMALTAERSDRQRSETRGARQLLII